MTNICAFSDTHGMHANVVVPKSDILIFAGDFTSSGLTAISNLWSFYGWLQSLVAKHIIIVPGNHDGLFDSVPSWTRKELEKDPRIHVLIDESIELKGIKFYGSPRTPMFCNWYFMYERDEGKAVWNKIPDDTNVLITHGPPHGILDMVEVDFKQVGCWHLRQRVKRLKKLKYHIFGHIHEGYGIWKQDGIVSYNVSSCTELYHPVNKPIKFEYK